MIKPVDFDPNKKYPVIVYVYGEPAGATVQNKWDRYDLWHQYMAQHGYVVVSIDPRGTKTPRGREWRKSIYEKIGIVAADDHAAAVEQLLRDCTYLDAERIGIWGWSGGGSMTLTVYSNIHRTGYHQQDIMFSTAKEELENAQMVQFNRQGLCTCEPFRGF